MVIFYLKERRSDRPPSPQNFLYQKKLFYSGDTMSSGKVGSKGELFPPKDIREKMGLFPGQNIIYHVIQGRLIIEKILAPDEILKKQMKGKISLEEIKKNRLELSEDAEK